MSNPFRIIDTGVREGRSNIAFDAALIELRQQDRVPDTIRFLRFPPTALIGRHQDLSREVNLEYCAEDGVGTVRRITGGGAIYLDEGQLGWELVFHRSSLGIAALPDLAREICNAAAAGLSKLGIDARFRPRNDIEVAGRKISGTGGFFDGDILIYQGTVLVDMSPAQMVRALNIPAAKVAKHNLDTAEQRVVTLKELLGDKMPNMEAIKAALIEGFTEGLGITAEPAKLWPPNHKMRDVVLSVDVEDICDSTPHCEIVEDGVFSNEPDDESGDGKTSPDWIITGNLTLKLRAERAGRGDGRVYTVNVICVDGSSNSTTGTTTISVPHNKK